MPREVQLTSLFWKSLAGPVRRDGISLFAPAPSTDSWKGRIITGAFPSKRDHDAPFFVVVFSVQAWFRACALAFSWVGDCVTAVIHHVWLWLSEMGHWKSFVKWEIKPWFILVTDQDALHEKRFYFCTKWCRWKKKKACGWELLLNHDSYHIFSRCLQLCIEWPRQVSILVHKLRRSFLCSLIFFFFYWTAGKLPYGSICTTTVCCSNEKHLYTNKEASHASKQINVLLLYLPVAVFSGLTATCYLRDFFFFITCWRLLQRLPSSLIMMFLF